MTINKKDDDIIDPNWPTVGSKIHGLIKSDYDAQIIKDNKGKIQSEKINKYKVNKMLALLYIKNSYDALEYYLNHPLPKK